MFSVAHRSRDPKLFHCELCDRAIKAVDWRGHVAGKKHRLAETQEREAGKKAAIEKKNGADAGFGSFPVEGFKEDGFVAEGLLPDDEWGGNWDDNDGSKDTTGASGFNDIKDNQREHGRGCFNCGEEGHISKDCSQRAARGNGCYNCGDPSHNKRDCPSLEADKCFKCGLSGHMKKDCPNQANGSSNKCYNCGEPGHQSRECDKPKGPMTCKSCGEEGHRMSNCPKTKCYRCNNYGHMSRNCPDGDGENANPSSGNGWGGGGNDNYQNSGWGGDEADTTTQGDWGSSENAQSTSEAGIW